MKNTSLTKLNQLKPKRLSPEDILSEVRGEKCAQKEVELLSKMENDLIIINSKIAHLQGGQDQAIQNTTQSSLLTSSPFVTQIRSMPTNDAEKSNVIMMRLYHNASCYYSL